MAHGTAQAFLEQEREKKEREQKRNITNYTLHLS
jgi:hypothetical protein